MATSSPTRCVSLHILHVEFFGGREGRSQFSFQNLPISILSKKKKIFTICSAEYWGHKEKKKKDSTTWTIINPILSYLLRAFDSLTGHLVSGKTTLAAVIKSYKI